MKRVIGLIGIVFVVCLSLSNVAHAHCDTLDGPVVIDAKIALKNKDVTPVLKWVGKDSEKEIKESFNNTLIEIARNSKGKEVAEMRFFSDLVKIHRAGEGASFDGLKPAGEVEPIVKTSDDAIEAGSIEELNKKIIEGVEKRFSRVVATMKHKDKSVEKGREYVKAYVDFMHYVEKIYSVASESDGRHEHEKESEKHHDMSMAHIEQEVTMSNVLENIPYQEEGMGKRKLVNEKHLLMMQAALKPGQSVPQHNANSNVHLLILSGEVVVNLDGVDNVAKEGTLLPVANKTPMGIKNNSQEKATFLIIKTPNPSEMM